MRKSAIATLLLKTLRIIIMLAGIPTSGLALNNEEVFSQFQFNFITPGARATALGGAFIGLADDATAVEANPAGLTILTDSEVSIELKHIIYTAEQIYRNLSYEAPIMTKEFDDIIDSISFISIVYPCNRFVFSFYRQELVNYKSSYRSDATRIAIPGTENRRLRPRDASVELKITNYGFGAAIELFDGLSLAISPRWSELNMKSHYDTFGFQGVYPSDFSDDDLKFHSEIDNQDFGYSITAGVLWTIHPKCSLGGVYKQGTRFTVPENARVRIPGTTDFSSVVVGDRAEFTMPVPESFGAGIALRLTEFLSVTFDIVHIQYEDLLNDFDIMFEDKIYTSNNYIIDNVTEFHVGIEYLLPLGERFFALRAGCYTDPDHTIRFTGTTEELEADISGRAKFPGSEDQIHITGGLGLVVNDRFQIDTAANIASRSKQLSLSMVYRF